MNCSEGLLRAKCLSRRRCIPFFNYESIKCLCYWDTFVMECDINLSLKKSQFHNHSCSVCDHVHRLSKAEYELIYSGQDFTLVSMTVRIPKLMIQWTFQRICNQFRMSKSDIYRLRASTQTFENHIEVNDEEENVTWMNHTNLFLTILGHCA